VLEKVHGFVLYRKIEAGLSIVRWPPGSNPTQVAVWNTSSEANSYAGYLIRCGMIDPFEFEVREEDLYNDIRDGVPSLLLMKEN
jgi:hypothetical protein